MPKLFLTEIDDTIRKLFQVAFGTAQASDEECVTAFRLAKKRMASKKITIDDILLPGWGKGPLISALKREGDTVLPSGTYVGQSISAVLEKDPNYLLNLSKSGGFIHPTFNDVLSRIMFAYTQEMLIRFSGLEAEGDGH